MSTISPSNDNGWSSLRHIHLWDNVWCGWHGSQKKISQRGESVPKGFAKQMVQPSLDCGNSVSPALKVLVYGCNRNGGEQLGLLCLNSRLHISRWREEEWPCCSSQELRGNMPFWWLQGVRDADKYNTSPELHLMRCGRFILVLLDGAWMGKKALGSYKQDGAGVYWHLWFQTAHRNRTCVYQVSRIGHWWVMCLSCGITIKKKIWALFLLDMLLFPTAIKAFMGKPSNISL